MLVLVLYVVVIASQSPSSQSAELAVVVNGIDPPNDAGLRADVIIDTPVTAVRGCDDEVRVTAIISGTPRFWSRHRKALKSRRRVGIGLRTSYDHASLRILDWSGYSLPRDLANLGGDERVPSPMSRITRIPHL